MICISHIRSAPHTDYNHTDTESTETNLCKTSVRPECYDPAANGRSVFRLSGQSGGCVSLVWVWSETCVYLQSCEDSAEATRQERLGAEDNYDCLGFTKTNCWWTIDKSVAQGSRVTYRQLPEEQIFYIYALVVSLVVIIELPILLVMSPIT
mgnify:CR=1 FL=1